MKQGPVPPHQVDLVAAPDQAAGAACARPGSPGGGWWTGLLVWPLLALLTLMPLPALAAEVDGRSLSAWWALPFAGMLLSIAIMPLAIPQIWHHHFGKIAAGWALLLLVPFAITQGVGLTGGMLVHVLLAEYIPFIVLLTALFTVAGGIYVRGNLHGSPGLNTAIMGIGAVLASFTGPRARPCC